MSTEALAARLSALEQIIIIIITGGWPGRPGPPPGDSFASDISRFEALSRAYKIPRYADPPPPEVSRLSLVEAEASLLGVKAEVTRLRGLEGELTARIEALRVAPNAG